MATDRSKRSQVSGSVPPRKINVQKFAETRACELEALSTIVAGRLDGDFKSRRNKRRRTTAHDSQARKRGRKRQKLGVGDRSNELATGKDVKKVSRRVRRRYELRRNPTSGFCTSGDGTKRLRTHVWHAKRFTMTKLWGFHLPLGLHGRGRGSRALLKWFKQGALVHDASYYVAVQLEGPEDSLMSTLSRILVPSPSVQSDDVLNSVLSGNTYKTAMLHHAGAPLSQSIAPVTYMWRPSHQQNGGNDHNDSASDGTLEPWRIGCCSTVRQLWVWLHASAFVEGYDALKLACQKEMRERGILINCLSLEGQLAKIEVMGSNSFQLLQKTLHPLTCVSNNYWQLKHCSSDAEKCAQVKKSCILEDEKSVSSLEVLSLTVRDPRAWPQKRTLGDPDLASTSVFNVMPEIDGHVSVPKVVDKNKELFPLSQSMPEEDEIYYDKKILWDACNGLDPPLEENVICLERRHLLMDSICFNDPKTKILNTLKNTECSQSCPVMLLKNHEQKGSFPRWSLVLPLSWAKVFWTSFVSKGAHAIGLREKHWIACEVGLPCFPSDFPDCHAYSSLMATEAAVYDRKAERRPPAIRPVRTPMPPPWDCVRTTSISRCIGIGINQTSSQKDVVHGNSTSNSNCDCDVASFNHDGNSFDGIVARTSSVLTNFLKETYGDRLLLFPRAPNSKGNLLKFMKDESKPGQGQNGIADIDCSNKLCLLRVLLHAFKEGAFEEGAVVCAPRLSDISLWISSSENLDGNLQMPQSAVGSYFKEQSSGKWELQIPDDPALMESHRWPIGFVTTGFVRGSKKPVAVAFCEGSLLAHLREEQWNELPVKRRRKEIYVIVRNIKSSAYRVALATIVLEQKDEDVEFF